MKSQTNNVPKLSPTQQAAYDRLVKEKKIDWSSTTSIEARALNTLVTKGLAEKTSGISTQYKIKSL